MTGLQEKLARLGRSDETARAILKLLMGRKRIRSRHKIKQLVREVQGIHPGATDSSVRLVLKRLAGMMAGGFAIVHYSEGAQYVTWGDALKSNLPRALMRGRKAA
jgi:hypothetical protein